MAITGITVSVELKRSTYGTGGADVENRFVSLKAETPEGNPGLGYDEALEESLRIQLRAWESLLAAEASMGNLDSETFNKRLERARKRLGKLITFFKETPE